MTATSTASPQALLAEGEPELALQALQQQVRSRPDDVLLRIFLFQLLCVLGQWQRALTQLELCGQLDAATLPMVNTYREAIQCELVRASVFAGRTTPMVFGRPATWVALLVQALAQQAQGQTEQARRLRAEAFDAAPPTSGSLNGEGFDWIADADSRLGPVLEVVLNGRYTWLPFEMLSAVIVEPPADLRDLVWLPAQLTFANRGESVALIPSRYPGTHDQPQNALRLSRGTEWQALAEGQFAGIGQRVLATPSAELGLLDVREIRLDTAAAA